MTAGSIGKFYAVTRTSVYEVTGRGAWVAEVRKIALQGTSELKVGEDIAEGGMVAICSYLQTYIPEKYGRTAPMTGYERNFRRVNSSHWRAGTSPLTALFLDKDEAMRCFETHDREPMDPRWLEASRATLQAIGDDHPSFFVSHDRDLGFLEQAVAA